MASLTKFQSDVLLGQVASSDLGYSFKEVTVTIAAGMEMGSVLESTSVAGKYTWVVVATVGNADAILIDPKAQGYDEVLAAGDHTLVVAVRGVTIAEQELNFGDGVSAGNIATAIAAFEAAGANKVTDKVYG